MSTESCNLGKDIIKELVNEIAKSLTERGFNCRIRTYPSSRNFPHDSYRIMNTGPNKNWDNIQCVDFSTSPTERIILCKPLGYRYIPLTTPYNEIIKQIVAWWSIEPYSGPYRWIK